MTSTLLATLLTAAWGFQPGAYYGTSDYGHTIPSTYGSSVTYGYGGYGAPMGHYGHHGFATSQGFAPSSYGFSGPTYGFSQPAPVFSGSAYGAPASSFDPCPFASSGRPSDVAAAPQSRRHEALYGPPGGREPRPRPAAVVRMTDQARFEPAEITISVGDTVEWQSTSRHAHTVTLNPDLAKNAASVALPEGARPFDSGEIAPGGNFAFTFNVPGEYRYVCLPHEDKGMVGTIIVKPRSGRGYDDAPDRGQAGPPDQPISRDQARPRQPAPPRDQAPPQDDAAPLDQPPPAEDIPEAPE